jgi:hypothetical protein
LFSRYLSPVTSPEGTYSDESEEPVPASVTIISPLSEGAGSQTGTPEISAACSYHQYREPAPLTLPGLWYSLA